MAKVYALPEELEVKVPVMDFDNMATYDKAEKEFIEEVKTWCKTANPHDKYAGERYRIPMADGYAEYVVLSSSPMALLHLPIGDKWDSPYANGTTKKALIAKIEADKKWAEFVEKNGHGNRAGKA